MVTSSSSPAPRRPVVRALSSASDRPCARPGCPAPARATLTFSYDRREVALDRLTEESQPQGYDLCGPHANRSEPPRGWELTDRRPPEDLTPAPVRDDRELGGEATVAVLAAALRAVPPPAEAQTPSSVPPAVADRPVEDADGPPPPPIPLVGDAPAPAATTDTVEIRRPADLAPRQVPAARDR